ncbi:MAG TPA: LEA type 2 family protein, partial [Candidatus Acidoferrum sp.]|nr:LEA type 2 family protein [Candidatus Acidoferrum sp.]
QRAIVGICLLSLSACASWEQREPLNVTVADITPLDVNLLEQRYAVKVRLLNPNDTEIAFDGVVFSLEINDKPFAKGVSDRGGTIPRFGEAVIDLQVVSGLQNILQQIAEIQKGDRAGFTYHIKGRLHISGGPSIPFDTKGEFNWPQGGEKSGT